VLSAACAKAPEHRLDGRWQSLDGAEILEFKDEGTVVQSDARGPLFGGTFKFVASDRIKVSFGGPSEVAPPRTYRIALDADSLSITDENGKTRRYHRQP